MTLIESIKSVIKGDVDDAKDVLEKYSRDTSLFRIEPQVVAYPKDVADVESLVVFASEEKNKGNDVALAVRGGGTDMSGGPLTNSIAVDVSKYLNKLIEVEKTSEDGGYAIAESGLHFIDLDEESSKKELLLPSFPASRRMVTVGGMVSNDAAGEKSLRYGKTHAYVEEIDAVLADGKKHTFKALTKEELDAKCEQKDFEGHLYQQMRELVEKNDDAIAKARPNVAKNSSGYALWRVQDTEKGTFNLGQLLVGAQGTLGIITKVRIGLVKPKKYSAMTVLFLYDLSNLGDVVNAMLKHKPDSFESYDDNTFKLALKYFWEFAAQMKRNVVGLGFSFLPEFLMILTQGMPKLLVLAEFTGDSREEVVQKAHAAAKDMRKQFHITARVAEDEQASDRYWAIRRESFNLLRKKVTDKRTAPFIDDFVVRPEVLPQFLPELEVLLDDYKDKMMYTMAGHIGEGNFHIIPLIDPEDPDVPKMVEDLARKVNELVISYSGSITGEHNDGLIRTPYVERMFGSDMYHLFEETKKVFDPLGIFNPGKKVGMTVDTARKYLDIKKIKPKK